MQIAEIYISHILDSGCGFAARTDNGEQCFLPASVIKTSGVVDGDIATAKLIPNTHPNAAATPWVAVHAARAEDGAALSPEPVRLAQSLSERVYNAVCDLGYATTAETAKEVGEDIAITHNALLALFGKGRVAKADIYARPDQARASFCMWAKDVNHFLGEAGE
jgi:hypothetical protein